MILSNRQRNKLIDAGFAEVRDLICPVNFGSGAAKVRAEDLDCWAIVPTEVGSDLQWDAGQSGGVSLAGFERGTKILTKLLYVFVQTVHGLEVFVASPSVIRNSDIIKKLGLRRTNTFYQFALDARDLFARMSGQMRCYASDEEIPEAADALI